MQACVDSVIHCSGNSSAACVALTDRYCASVSTLCNISIWSLDAVRVSKVKLAVSYRNVILFKLP